MQQIFKAIEIKFLVPTHTFGPRWKVTVEGRYMYLDYKRDRSDEEQVNENARLGLERFFSNSRLEISGIGALPKEVYVVTLKARE